jgi:hypothetical protein
MARALAQLIVDKIPLQQFTEHGYSCAQMAFYAIPVASFWEIVRYEARRILNKAVGYPA